MIFQENDFSCYVQLTDRFDCLIAYTPSDIGQYGYCNYFFPSLRRHKVWNYS